MVKFITGAKGSGKTKWLIDNANEDFKSGNGNIAFLDTDDDHIFSLDFNIRLINAKDYEVDNISSFYGFICGMLAMDYDLEKIYIDSIYKVIEIGDDMLESIFNTLNRISNDADAEIYLNINRTIDEMPEGLKEHCVEVSLEN